MLGIIRGDLKLMFECLKELLGLVLSFPFVRYIKPLCGFNIHILTTKELQGFHKSTPKGSNLYYS